MTSLSSSPLIFGSLLFAFSAAARTSGPPLDSLGRPVCDASGQPLIYSQKESQENPNASPLSERSLRSAVPALESTPSPAANVPFWSYGVFGSNIGSAGMLPVAREHGVDLIVSGSTSTFGKNDFWYVLSHDPVTGGYQQSHVQAPYRSTVYAGEIASMSLANVAGDAVPELVVGLTDGRFFFYSTSTFEELGTLTPVTSLTDFATADLDGDGTAELIVLTSSTLRVFNPAGQLLWSVSGPGGSDLVIAQMDQDPALEIATTSGHVVDAATHAVQWTRAEGFGANLRAADIDGDQRAELIVADSWYYLTAYDVDLQLPKWSYRTSQDIGSIEIANVDSDPAMELLYGDGQSGELHVMTLNSATPIQKWSVWSSESGVQRITVVDADDDGVPEILWSSGGNSTGRDVLDVLDTITRQSEWKSVHLDGPFLSPVVGDVTGDGVPELVTACSESDSSYSSGRVLVFDSATLKLLGISQPIADNRSWTGLRDLKLRDVDGDGRLEIVVGADSFYDGLVEIYSFTDSRTFERKWTNTSRPSGAPFSQVDVLDVDNDGNLEIVAGNDTEHTGSIGNYVRVIDYATNTEEWRSPHLGGSWGGVKSLAIGDLDGDGNLEAVASVSGVGIAVMDLKLRSMEFTQSGDFPTVSVRPGGTGFLAGTGDGKVNYYTPNGAGSYEVTDSWTVSSAAITGLTPGDDDSLWVNTERQISYWPDSTGSTWTSADLGSDATGPVALLDTADGFDLFAGVSHAVDGFEFVTVTTPEDNRPVVSVTASDASASEPTGKKVTDPGKFVFHRTGDLSQRLEIRFNAGGTATAGFDYGAIPTQLVFQPGADTVSLAILPRADHQAEPSESVELQLATSTDYRFNHSSSAASITLSDSEPVVSIISTRTVKTGVAVNLERIGGSNQPLTVVLKIVNTQPGSGRTIDFQRVVFRKGAGSAQFLVRAKKKATQPVQITAELIDDGKFHLGDSSSVSFDLQPAPAR